MRQAQAGEELHAFRISSGEVRSLLLQKWTELNSGGCSASAAFVCFCFAYSCGIIKKTNIMKNPEDIIKNSNSIF
jgi:hypothetical protein